MEEISRAKSFGGVQSVWRAQSVKLRSPTRFGVFLPPGEGPFPALFWLSGLTCTEDNFIAKAGAQRAAAEHGFAIIAPDTSPRGEGVATDPAGAWDLGLGAGFYVDATEAPWAAHYQMYSFVTEELPTLIAGSFPVDPARFGIFGHSMGGHGALVAHLRHPTKFRSCSAFAPIVAPSQVPWGRNAFSAYLGENPAHWAEYDATALVRRAPSAAHVLIDQGAADQFLERELRPDLFAQEAVIAGQQVTLRRHEGYDHSYFFIASFIDDHIAWHAAALRD